MSTPPPLFHYTCRHMARRITGRGMLRPHVHPLLGVRLVWLTDMHTPDRVALGLTCETLDCDRLEVRYVVTDPAAEWWPAWAARTGIPRRLRLELELERQPERWYVLTRAALGVRDLAYRPP